MSASHAGMPSRRLGRDGPEISALALGTMTFGVETTEAEAHRMLDAFVERGGTFIDTADVYSGGESEAIIGRWLAARGHDDLVVATKARFAPPDGVAGASRAGLTAAVEGSLARLGTECVDLYYVHGWDRDTPLEETLETLGDLARSGKVGATGWSNLAGWQLQRVVTTAEARGLPVPVVLQPQYNLLDRGIELEVAPCCLDAGVSIVPWSPLAGGWLTGKYSQARPTGATRLGENPARGVEAFDLRNTERTRSVLTVLRAVAERHDRPPAHVALAWLLARPGVASILLGARTVEQMTDNLGAADLALTADDVSELTAVSAPGLPPYPYGFLADWSGLDVWKRLGTGT